MEDSFSTRKLLSGTELKVLNAKSDFAGFLQLGSHIAQSPADSVRMASPGQAIGL